MDDVSMSADHGPPSSGCMARLLRSGTRGYHDPRMIMVIVTMLLTVIKAVIIMRIVAVIIKDPNMMPLCMRDKQRVLARG